MAPAESSVQASAPRPARSAERIRKDRRSRPPGSDMGIAVRLSPAPQRPPAKRNRPAGSASSKSVKDCRTHLISQSGLCHNKRYRLMANPSILDQDPAARSGSQTTTDSAESFGDILSQYEQSHSHKPDVGGRGLEGTVIAISGEFVFLDIGYKIEGIIPVAEFQATGDSVKPGDRMPVSIKGRDPEGYYELSRIKVERPRDWSSLEKAFADKAAIAGVITAVGKGGVSVDVGGGAFLPAPRGGAKGAAERKT